jgi:hypothetical protein
MAHRSAAGQPRKLSPEDARVHREIDREHFISYEYMVKHGREAPLHQFPAIRRLLESCDEAARAGYKFSGKQFRYRDRTFPVQLTNCGRVFVVHPDTRKRLGTTSWFGAW